MSRIIGLSNYLSPLLHSRFPSPSRDVGGEVGLEASHVSSIITLLQPTVDVLLVQLGQPVAIEVNSQPGRRGDDDASLRPLQRAVHNDILISSLPRPVSVASVVEVRRCGRQMCHGGKRDAEMRVAVHAQPHAPDGADSCQVLRTAETAPEVVV